MYQGKFSLKQKLCAKKFLVRKLRTNQDLGERKADLRNTTPVSLFISEKNKKPRKASFNEFHSDVGSVSESDYLLLRFFSLKIETNQIVDDSCISNRELSNFLH